MTTDKNVDIFNGKKNVFIKYEFVNGQNLDKTEFSSEKLFLIAEPDALTKNVLFSLFKARSWEELNKPFSHNYKAYLAKPIITPNNSRDIASLQRIRFQDIETNEEILVYPHQIYGKVLSIKPSEK